MRAVGYVSVSKEAQAVSGLGLEAQRAQLEEAAAIFLQHRPGATPVGIVASAGADGERIVLSNLDGFLEEAIDMKTTVIVGNRSSKWIDQWLVTPRGYHV